ncbi:hypothetical protein JQ634_21585 [Bradyrhizobium sp. AUGA SZCCT0240]|uniref:hypothetical protein n=1 Tax=unclassified Bradyrhizobium TaxID=2631580 RepID=UPI001BAE5192|nr:MULTISPECIES: hypothetical protein [unclassified Bradyrhizobium]MBR1195786.1 hypothetical protein [Bradyrhizobium sp. AUGA SZCCT0158]MBR1240185.1 hypothetical protein [Bradyrhizobium sp. AUGA SZCCT0274]MBR1256286.1 hypothetical protein [Bradyrhizobium sp. AUGA SZCCT0240]
MITSTAGAGSYLRPAQTSSTTVLTRADALPVPQADASTTTEKAKQGIPVSELKKLDTSGLKAVSIKDHPELRDRMAMMWLATQAANSAAATDVPDNAPQNIYATVKVNGKVVATLSNGGSSVMTNAAAATVGDLQDPPGLIGGPDLAQSRAERIAKGVGGTIEKASTAITQSAWRPRQSVSTSYTRQQLDAAFEAMQAEGQKAIAQRQTGYSVPQGSAGAYADISA